MRIFDQINHVDQDPAGYSEPAFNYLNRTARPIFVQIREFLEDWFSRYPNAHKEELRSRLRSPIDAHYHAAFFELLLHQLFLRLEADIEVHPAIPNTSRSPDFLIRLTEGQPFILEATVVTFLSANEVAGQARLNQVYDILDRDVDPTNYFIWVEVDSSPVTPPPAKRIAEFINEHLGDLDPDELSDLYQRIGDEAIPIWQFKNDGWSILFRPMLKKPQARGRIGARPLGGFSSGLKEVDFHTQLRDAVIKKAASYGKIPYPFVVAVNALEPVSDFDIGAALYGTEKVTIPFTKEGAPDPDHSKISRELDGVWTSFKGPSRQRVSAVLVTSSLRPWSLSEASFAAFHNPWATFPLTFAVNKIQQHILLKDQLVKIEGQPLPELLGFPWPPDVTTS